ncbi:MAG: nucleotidyltransferase domain-containing protein [Magnetococcales bacterium]|nr:nucleotidyltransferase domain-containing protein [Magnetococcales bacterium]
MADQAIVEAVRHYIRVLNQEGILVEFAVLYGSHARGEETEWSDIDVMVVSSLFDGPKRREDINHIWHATLQADVRIEPVGVGLRQWEAEDRIPLIDIVRREGLIIYPEARSAMGFLKTTAPDAAL